MWKCLYACASIYICIYKSTYIKGLAAEVLGEEETPGREEFLQKEKWLTWFSGNKEEGNKV